MAAPYTNPPPQQPRGTAAALAASNLVIPDGVIVVETDTGRLKIGDGSTAWNSLRYVTVDAAAVTIHPFLLMGA